MIAVVAVNAFVRVEVPARIVQLPVPTEGAFAFKVAVVEQSVVLDPAEATVGKSSRIIVIVDVLGKHVPFVIFHSRLLIPTESPVTLVELVRGLVTVAVPLSTVQLPVPTVGILALIVAEDEQSVNPAPAFEGLGKS